MIITERARRILNVNEEIWKKMSVDEIADFIVALQVHLQERLLDDAATRNEKEDIENVNKN